MNDKRNVIVMFLLIMLSFAIITEVSAASEAEINGTGPNSPVMSHDISQHDIASERYNENQMQDHFDVDYFQSHDGQKSFDKTPQCSGDNKSNEILYKHNMDLKPVDNPKDLNQSPEFMFNDNPMGNFNSSDLSDNNFTNLSKNGELMNNVVSNLMGLNNIAPNFKKDDLNVSPDSITDQKPVGEKNNESAPSDNGSFNIVKNAKTQKIIKKAKLAKKSNKKVKSIKKPKKVIKKLPKKSKKERAKL